MLFDSEDFESYYDKSNSTPPDGFLNVKTYTDKFSDVVNDIAMLETSDDKSRMLFMMRLINHVDFSELDEKAAEQVSASGVYELISALAFHVTTMMGIMNEIDSEIRTNYLSMMWNQIIPDMSDSQDNLPYWE